MYITKICFHVMQYWFNLCLNITSGHLTDVVNTFGAISHEWFFVFARRVLAVMQLLEPVELQQVASPFSQRRSCFLARRYAYASGICLDLV